MHAFFIHTTTSHKIKKASPFKIKEYAKINHHLLSDLEQLLLTQAFVAVCDGQCRSRWWSQWKVINRTSAFVSPCRCRSLRRWSGWRKSRQLNTSIARAHKALCSITLESTTIRWVHPDIVLALTIAGATNKRHCVPCVNKWNTCTEPMYKNSIYSNDAYKSNPKTLKCNPYNMWFALQVNNQKVWLQSPKGLWPGSPHWNTDQHDQWNGFQWHQTTPAHPAMSTTDKSVKPSAVGNTATSVWKVKGIGSCKHRNQCGE